MLAKTLAKSLIALTCSRKLQHAIRLRYTVRQILQNKHYREPEMMALESLVTPGSVALDIGANVGVYTHALSKLVGPEGRVFSFEPVAETHAILWEVIKATGLENVSVFKAAVGSREEAAEMIVPDMAGFTGFYWAHLAGPGDSGRRETVRVKTLDSLYDYKIIERVDFLKCDVEGGELDVIHGGLTMIRAQKPTCLIEVSKPTSRQLFALFQELGYKAYIWDGQLTETAVYRDREFSNYFFIHPERTCPSHSQ